MTTGHYYIPRNASLRDRFDASFIPEPNSGCWLWIGATTTHSNFTRGQISSDGKNQYAARVSFNLHKGPIPAGKIVCHRCNNSLCVNPEHLYAGTHKDNTADMWRSGRNRSPVGRGSSATLNSTSPARRRPVFVPPPAGYLKTRCGRGHDFSVTGVYVRPRGVVECRECKRNANLSYSKRKRAQAA